MISSDWSRDGRYVLYTNTTPSGFAVWAWPTFGDRKPFAVVQTSLNAMHARLSPDGKWVAYTSDESGEPQVYVQPFPPTGDKKQISPHGGAEPRWRRDGNELFYLATDERLMAVPVPEKNAFAAGVPLPLFEVRVPSPANVYRTNYAVTSDGQRFLVDRRVDDDNPTTSVVLNWQAGLKR
jgi:hypothetical protein